MGALKFAVYYCYIAEQNKGVIREKSWIVTWHQFLFCFELPSHYHPALAIKKRLFVLNLVTCYPRDVQRDWIGCFSLVEIEVM